MKKVFIISSVLLAVVLLFWGIYELAFRNNPTDPRADSSSGVIDVKNPDSGKGIDVAAPSTEDAVIRAVVTDQVVSPVFRKESDSVIYLSPQDASIKEARLPDFDLHTVMELTGRPVQAVWSPDISKALVELEQAGEKRWHLIDLESRGDALLKAGIESPAWDNLGDKIVYKYFDSKTGERSLNVANPDGSDWREIAKVSFKNMRASAIPQTSLLAFWNEGNAFEETSLQSISLAGSEISPIFSGKFGADYRFSPDGLRVVTSASSQKGGSDVMLMMMNSRGGELRSLSVPTLASKVAWSRDSETLYFALPGALPSGAVLPNDYYSRPIHTQDTFWRMDTTDGKKDRLVGLDELNRGYDATRLFTDADEENLFFVNRTDGKLYRIKLR